MPTVSNGAKTCVAGVVRHEAGLSMTLANPHVLSVSIDAESGSCSVACSTRDGDPLVIATMSHYGTLPKFRGATF